MDPWQKENVNLQVGDFIIWQDEAIEMEGQPAVVAPGMKGKAIPPKAIVQFDSGMRLMVDARMMWEKTD